ncbi:anthrone oxygenase family protein [Pseudomonas sp. LFM046]|uniref:anthrone oxygenase family protein n=1 Tax=Pseudomonas sp. LFM046 TaxID=1608357 RepID=UPI0005CFD003|nr:anthrone oxygenase family protein [Pseudomonas sp. LFM046]
MPFIDDIAFLLAFLCAIACGLMGGLFFAFSNFVMQALARLSPEAGIAAMQAINQTVLNRLFLATFLGTSAACGLLTLYAYVHWEVPGTFFLLIGSLLYLLGTFGVTLVCNVPRNNALARLDVSNPGSEAAWRTYVEEWTRWNHVRTGTALAASAMLTIALCLMLTLN